MYYLDYGPGTGELRRFTFVGAVNQPPSAIISALPLFGDLPLAITFSASSSIDPEGEPLTYSWDLDGDGLEDSNAAEVQFVYTQGPAAVEVSLTVTDVEGLTDTIRETVYPGNNAPGERHISS